MNMRKYCSISWFILSVCPSVLRVVRRRRVALDAHQLVKVLHEPGLELGASIMDDLPGNPMQPEDVISVVLQILSFFPSYVFPRFLSLPYYF